MSGKPEFYFKTAWGGMYKQYIEPQNVLGNFQSRSTVRTVFTSYQEVKTKRSEPCE